MDPQKRDRLFQAGLEAFNSGHYYEAHEHWEEVWLRTQNPEKTFLQGLIQIAAAYHHYSRENILGCRNLLQAGLLKLESCPAKNWGLAIEPLRASVRQWLVPLRAGGSPGNLKIPRIQADDKRGPSAGKK